MPQKTFLHIGYNGLYVSKVRAASMCRVFKGGPMPGVTPAEVLSNFGITLVEDPAENQPRLLVDLPAAELVEHAIRRNEGRMASNGALVIETGERT